ncbi:VPEID-CTERM sorting domain-containing protein [Citreimonas salinaria]|uniref:VPEID-CTERM protein sorting domain-containing protein n=1 Tax=Citreimonas salinaria TaxID=321339 RepID=A0A1H3MTE3_9RHOB|nr:VPEID-CTERM sorting domain-containing protein [Citreimonas salinaria]SDY79846.1 VPEID-CTERM protein sorting domain-containing protein [Citreimonas salinaria]
MTRYFLGFTTMISVYAMSAGSALAQGRHGNGGGYGWWWGRGGGHGSGNGGSEVASVPEIDAASGVLALAAVAALVALFYELRRRRAARPID